MNFRLGVEGEGEGEGVLRLFKIKQKRSASRTLDIGHWTLDIDWTIGPRGKAKQEHKNNKPNGRHHDVTGSLTTLL